MNRTQRLMQTRETGDVGKKAVFHYRKLGFTMIEMLVTIGMIAILAALLVPAVMSMTESAKMGKCVANLRGCGSAILSQAADSSGRLVLPWASASGADLAAFPQLQGHPQSGLTWFQYLNQLGYISDLKVTVCPSFYPYTYRKATGNQSMMTYGMRRANATRYEPIMLQKVSTPSSYALLADSSKPGTWTGQNYYITYPGNSQDTFHVRHNQRANIFFLDGSVRPMNKDEIVNGLKDGWSGTSVDTKDYNAK